jgi:hypothetical protein
MSESPAVRRSVRDRVIDISRRVARPAFALPLLILCAAPARAEPPSPQPMLERRVIDAVQMLQGDPRYKKVSPQQLENRVGFVIGNTLFVLLHETAHALINELGIPVLGREEDAADALAALVALKMEMTFRIAWWSMPRRVGSSATSATRTTANRPPIMTSTAWICSGPTTSSACWSAHNPTNSRLSPTRCGFRNNVSVPVGTITTRHHGPGTRR